MPINISRLLIFSVIILLLLSGIFWLISSIEKKEGTLVFTPDAIVFTPEVLKDFHEPDLSGKTGEWFWVGFQTPVSNLLQDDCFAKLAERGFVNVKIIFLNSTMSAEAENSAAANLKHIIAFDIKPLEKCN